MEQGVLLIADGQSTPNSLITQGVLLKTLLYSYLMTKSPSRNVSRKIVPIKVIDGRQKPRPGPEEQSRAIVDAAVSLFLKHGVRSVSIMQICDAADISRSTFYRCFDGIDDLLQYIYSISVFQPVESFMLANFKKDKSSSIDIKQTLDDLYEAIFAQGEYAELLFRESNDPNSPAFQVVNDTFDNIVTSLQQALPKTNGKKMDATFLKAILNANQWIAHNAIRKGLTKKNKQQAKDAAWQLVEVSLNL